VLAGQRSELIARKKIMRFQILEERCWQRPGSRKRLPSKARENGAASQNA